MAFAARHRYIINTITDTLNIKDEGLVERCLRITENYSVLETFFSAQSKGAIYVLVVPPRARDGDEGQGSSASASSSGASSTEDDEVKGNGGHDDPLSLLVVAKGNEHEVDSHMEGADEISRMAGKSMCASRLCQWLMKVPVDVVGCVLCVRGLPRQSVP